MQFANVCYDDKNEELEVGETAKTGTTATEPVETKFTFNKFYFKFQLSYFLFFPTHFLWENKSFPYLLDTKS